MDSGPVIITAVKMARLATSAVQLCQRLQELYPHKLQLPLKQSEQSSPFRRWTTGSGAGSSYRHQDHRTAYNKQMSEGSAPTQPSSSGGVARWSLGLEQLLADAAGAAAFAHFLDKEYAAENIRFWWSCEQYRLSQAEAERSALATQIWQRHLAEGASDPVNVDAAALRAVTLRLHQTPPPTDLFVQAQKQIFNVMKFDSYPRFLRSGVHAECARADLRGLPPPYAPDNNKLKKSASNASERRRSGSLLPWRTRAAERERDDVVKASQSNGQCSLCRVVLPDGATSVVGVDDDVTVQRLVDRLLQRRNLDCSTYDVVLVEQGEGAAVPWWAPSSRLGGRVARVERRAVVRVLLGGRCVAVRCRPTRRLRHVLRPVLRRYWPALGAHRVVAGGPRGPELHPDTTALELDGTRVFVLETPGGVPDDLDDAEDGRSVSRSSVGSYQAVEDGVSDANIAGVSGGAESTDVSGISASAAVSEDAGSAGVSAGGSNAGGAGGAGGRVRAALRAGPPLHHHPPDFLENLRETQRQRLPARTPPPLPPKPRAPTLV